MRDILLIPSLLMLVFSLGLELLIVLGGGNYREIENAREKALSSKGNIDRLFARCFYILVDHRPFLGLLGLAGLIVSIFNK